MQNVFFPEGKSNSWPLTNTQNKAYHLFCKMWIDKTDKWLLFGDIDGPRIWVEQWTKYFKDRAEKLERHCNPGLLEAIKTTPKAGKWKELSGKEILERWEKTVE